MRKRTTFLLVLVILLIVIQFIQPDKNQSNQILAADITNNYEVPENVQGILKNSCYDCHSNNTHYPWYSQIQPGGWWMTRHVRKGKKDLNFSEFGNYSARRQKSKLKAIADVLKDDEMPLSSYTWLHPKAKLSDADKNALLRWVENAQQELARKNLQ